MEINQIISRKLRYLRLDNLEDRISGLPMNGTLQHTIQECRTLHSHILIASEPLEKADILKSDFLAVWHFLLLLSFFF